MATFNGTGQMTHPAQRKVVPGLGPVSEDMDGEWLVSEPIVVRMLGEEPRRITLKGYADDERPDDFHRAVRNFLEAAPSVLKNAGRYVFEYYSDCRQAQAEYEGSDCVEIARAEDVWNHVRLSNEPMFSRGHDGQIYVSLSCGCDWEVEHGLQICLRNGNFVNKVGMYDGHLTNVAAYADESYAGVVYVSR